MSNNPEYRKQKYSNIEVTNKNLIRYVKKGKINIVRYLVENGVDIHALNNRALIIGAENGHLKVVRYLVENGANIHTTNDYALRYSAKNGHLNVVKYLVENGANISAGHDYALRKSAENGHLEVVRYLVEKGANIHDYVLRKSIENNHLEIVKYLAEQGKIQDRDENYNNYVFSLSVEVGNLEIAKYYFENGADINFENSAPLRYAAGKGHLEIVRYLVEKGADIHALDDVALILSIANNHFDVVKYIIEKGANINVIDDEDINSITNEDIRNYIIKKKNRKNILRKTIRVAKQNIPKKEKNDITEWQSYCQIISNNTHIEELRIISLSVGLPVMKNDKYLSKVLLCSQLGIQLEQYLNINYKHDCNNDYLGEDLSKLPEDCIYKDVHNNCYSINDILDNQGHIKDSMRKNPYTNEEWELDAEYLKNKRNNCQKYTDLNITHEMKKYNKEDLQLGIVRNILIGLDNKIYSNNTDRLLESDMKTLNRLLSFLKNEGEVNYNNNELSDIRNNYFEIDFLAKLISITRSKINDDVILANLIELFFNPV